LSEKSDVEIPQKRQVLRDTNPKTILKKAAKVLKEDEINKRLEITKSLING